MGQWGEDPTFGMGMFLINVASACCYPEAKKKHRCITEGVVDDLMLTLSVIVLFLLRIGVPVLILVTLGVLLDRWQSRRALRIEERENR